MVMDEEGNNEGFKHPKERAKEIISLFYENVGSYENKVKCAVIYQIGRIEIIADYCIISEYEESVLIELKML